MQGGIDASDVPYTKRFARFNGTSWEKVPSPYYGNLTHVYDLIVYNDSLILATNYPETPSRICAYDADINDFVNIGSVPDKVFALEVYNEELYAGGQWFSLKKYVGGTGYEAWEDVGGNCNYTN